MQQTSFDSFKYEKPLKQVLKRRSRRNSESSEPSRAIPEPKKDLNVKRVSYDRPLSKLREMVNAGLFDGDMDDYNAL